MGSKESLATVLCYGYVFRIPLSVVNVSYKFIMEERWTQPLVT